MSGVGRHRRTPLISRGSCRDLHSTAKIFDLSSPLHHSHARCLFFKQHFRVLCLIFLRMGSPNTVLDFEDSLTTKSVLSKKSSFGLALVFTLTSWPPVTCDVCALYTVTVSFLFVWYIYCNMKIFVVYYGLTKITLVFMHTYTYLLT